MAALRARLERLELPGPVVTVELALDGLTSQTHAQLDLSKQGGTDPNALPTLLAELGAGLGPNRVGVLRLGNSHRPEARSKLVPADPLGIRPLVLSTVLRASPPAPILPLSDEPRADDGEPCATSLWLEPTRILPRPIEIGRLEPGALVSARSPLRTSSAGSPLYLIDRLQLSERIDRVQWWTPAPVCRDYAHAWLRTGERSRQGAPPELAEAWVYVERASGRGYLHGWYD